MGKKREQREERILRFRNRLCNHKLVAVMLFKMSLRVAVFKYLLHYYYHLAL